MNAFGSLGFVGLQGFSTSDPGLFTQLVESLSTDLASQASMSASPLPSCAIGHGDFVSPVFLLIFRTVTVLYVVIASCFGCRFVRSC